MSSSSQEPSRFFYRVEYAGEDIEVDLSQSMLSLIASYEAGRENQWWLTRNNSKSAKIVRLGVIVSYIGPFFFGRETGALIAAVGGPLVIAVAIHQMTTWSVGLFRHLTSTFEFWFLTITNILTWTLCALSFSDYRALISFMGIVAIQATIGFDANVITRHNTLISMAVGAVVLAAISVAFWLRAVSDTSDIPFTVSGLTVYGVDIMGNGCLTLSIFFIKNIIRLRRRMSNDEKVSLTMYKCALKIVECDGRKEETNKRNPALPRSSNPRIKKTKSITQVAPVSFLSASNAAQQEALEQLPKATVDMALSSEPSGKQVTNTSAVLVEEKNPGPPNTKEDCMEGPSFSIYNSEKMSPSENVLVENVARAEPEGGAIVSSQMTEVRKDVSEDLEAKAPATCPPAGEIVSCDLRKPSDISASSSALEITGRLSTGRSAHTLRDVMDSDITNLESKVDGKTKYNLGRTLTAEEKQRRSITRLRWRSASLWSSTSMSELLASDNSVLRWVYQAAISVLCGWRKKRKRRVSEKNAAESGSVAVGHSTLCQKHILSWCKRIQENKWIYVSLYLVTSIVTPFAPAIGLTATLAFVVLYLSIINSVLVGWIAMSFDAIFASLQVIAAVVCLCDAVYYDDRCYFLIIFCIWFHMVLGVDALTPHYRRVLGFKKIYALSVIVPMVAGEIWTVAMLFLLRPTATGSTSILSPQDSQTAQLRNRVIFSSENSFRSFKIQVYSVVFSRMAMLFIWTVKLLYKTLTRPEEELLVLTGNVEYVLPQGFLTAKTYQSQLKLQQQKLQTRPPAQNELDANNIVEMSVGTPTVLEAASQEER